MPVNPPRLQNGLASGRGYWRRLYRAGRQVKPLVAAIRNGWQAAPIHDPGVVVQQEHDGGRGLVKKVQAALPPLPLEAESAYPAARDTNQAIVAISKREENQIDQALGAALQVTAEAQQPLPVAAERVGANSHRTAVRPKDFIAFVLDLLVVAISAWIATEKNSQGACHALRSRGNQATISDVRRSVRLPAPKVPDRNFLGPHGPGTLAVSGQCRRRRE